MTFPMSSFASLFVITLALPVIVISADEKTTTEPEPIPLLIWAAGDPAEDDQVLKVEPRKFVPFVEAHRLELGQMYKENDIVGATFLFSTNAEDSGAKGVNWALVFARIGVKKLLGPSEEEEHGVPALVIWAFRNTGPGTSYPEVETNSLLIYILQHKKIILTYLTDGDVRGLADYLATSASESGSTSLDWNLVINDLKANRPLFKYPCGLLGLKMCDYTEKK